MPPQVRIGDLLIESGVITREQLSEALTHQRTYGGRLGTCLVELHFIDDKTLTATLARQLSIPSATASQLEKCEAAAIKLLPAATAERLRAVPIRIDGGKLWMAMADPTDQQALGQLSQQTGKQVRPMVAPELLLQYALERYYKVKRKPRVMQVQTHAADLLSVDGPRTPAMTIAAALPPPAPSAASAPVEAPVYGTFGSGPLKIDVDAVAGFLDEQPAEERPAAPRMPMDKLAAALVAAQNDDAIFDVAMRYVTQDVGRLAVFVLRNGLLGGWRGIGIEDHVLRSINVRLDDVPVVAKPLAQGDAFVGRLYAADLGPLAAPLAVAREGLGVIVPVRIGKRAVGVIIGLDGSLNALRHKAELDKLTVKLDQALHISYLRRLLLQP